MFECLVYFLANEKLMPPLNAALDRLVEGKVRRHVNIYLFLCPSNQIFFCLKLQMYT